MGCKIETLSAARMDFDANSQLCQHRERVIAGQFKTVDQLTITVDPGTTWRLRALTLHSLKFVYNF